MDPKIGLDIARRSLRIAETMQPDLADSFLKVPLDYYRSDKNIFRERELFEKKPLAVVHVSQVKKPYDYVVQEVFGRSLLITRNEEGTAKVFINTCRHRGAEPAKGCGNRRLFTCPYHAWTYDINGNLLSMPQKDRFEDLDLAKMGLTELPSEERHGFVWVVLTPGYNIDVSAHLGEIDFEIGSWGYENYNYVKSRESVNLESNWKATLEGFVEGLHLPIVHRGTFDRYADVAVAADLGGYDAFGSHVRVFYVNMPKLMGDLHNEDERSVQVRNYANVVYWIFPNLILANTATEHGGTIHMNVFPGAEHTDSTQLQVGFLTSSNMTDPREIAFQEEQAELAVTSVTSEDGPVLASCGRGIRNGVEDALIGRNELGVQLLVKSLAKSIGVKLTSV